MFKEDTLNSIENLERVKKSCGECKFYSSIDDDYGRCKCTDAHGYDLLVEKNSYCNSFK